MKIILKGVLKKASENRGIIYPSDSMQRELIRLSELQDKVDSYKKEASTINSSTHGAVTKIGNQLYTRFGASDEDVVTGCNYFMQSDDLNIRAQALRFIILRIEKRIKKEHL